MVEEGFILATEIFKIQDPTIFYLNHYALTSANNLIFNLYLKLILIEILLKQN